jgi:HK97 family phage prohead protease
MLQFHNFGNMKHLQTKFEIKDTQMGMQTIEDVDMGEGVVKTVWARFGNIDLDNDIILPEAVTKTIRERGPMGTKLIWSLTDHHSMLDHSLGKPNELYVDGDKLVAVTKVVKTRCGIDTLLLYEAGCINQHSIGFATIKADWQNDKQEVRVIKELKLYEGSAVLWAANPMTETLDIKSIEQKQNRLQLLEKAVKDGKFTDETFSLMEIEIKQIQSLLTTQAAQALEPDYTKQISDELLKLHLKLI